VTVGRARIRLHAPRFFVSEAKFGGGGAVYGLVARIEAAAPGHKGSADAQQRRRILGDHRERGKRAGSDEIKAP
jgi:hypothetical protein